MLKKWLEYGDRSGLGQEPESTPDFITEALIGCFDFSRPQRLLDLGTGAGQIGLVVAQRQPESQVIGIDWMPAMITRAESLLEKTRLKNFKVGLMDMSRLKFPNEIFDGAFCRLGLAFMGDPSRALKETRRVVKSNGLVAVTSWDTADKNPWATVAWHCVHHFLGAEKAPELVMFRYSEPGELAQLVKNSYLPELVQSEISGQVSFSSWQDYWNSRLAASPYLNTLLQGLPENLLGQIETALQAAVVPYQQADGTLTFPAAAQLVRAIR